MRKTVLMSHLSKELQSNYISILFRDIKKIVNRSIKRPKSHFLWVTENTRRKEWSENCFFK